MTTAYNPAEVERLVAEARPGARDVDELTAWTIDSREHFPVTVPAATRILLRLAAMADQLEAARAEIERLRGTGRVRRARRRAQVAGDRGAG